MLLKIKKVQKHHVNKKKPDKRVHSVGKDAANLWCEKSKEWLPLEERALSEKGQDGTF